MRETEHEIDTAAVERKTLGAFEGSVCVWVFSGNLEKNGGYQRNERNAR